MAPRDPKQTLMMPAALNRPEADAPSVATYVPPARAEADDSSAPELGALLHSFRRRWPAAIGAGLLLALLGAAAVWFVMPAKFTSEVRVHVESTRHKSEIGQREEDYEHKNYVQTLKALIKSPTVLHAAVQKPDVVDLRMIRAQGNAALWLEKALKVDTDQGLEQMRVTLDGDNAEELPIILNAVARSFLDKVDDIERVKRQAKADAITKNYQDEVRILTEKRGELSRKLRAANRDDPVTTKAKLEQALTQRSNTENARLQMELKRKEAESELSGLLDQERVPSTIAISEAEVEREIKLDSSLKPIEDALQKLEAEIQQIEAVAKDEIKAQLLEGPLSRRAKARASMEAARKELRPVIEKREREKEIAKLRDEIVKKRNLVAFAKESEKTLAEAVKQRDGEIERLRGGDRLGEKEAAVIAELQDEVERRENALKKIGEQLEALKVDPIGTTRVSLQETATTPETKNTDRLLKYAGLAAFGMFGLGLAGVSWWDVRARRIYRAEDIVRGLGLGLVGTLPALPASARNSLASGTEPQDLFWQSLLTESVDAIRTVLLHSARNDSVRTIMITSASSGEGKTSLATHLAASLARAWRRTLLIDGDLRNPAAHRQFNVALEPGLSEVLRGEAELDDVVKPTSVSRLWMVPAGQWDTHALQALAQDNVRDLFERLKEQYDFIIIDSCPVLAVADALLLGQNVDGVLFSILHDVSRTPQVHAAYRRLASLGIRMLGAVVVGEPVDARSLGYHPGTAK